MQQGHLHSQMKDGYVPSEGESMRAWGHKFQWTSRHRAWTQYKPLKQTYDKLAEDCLNVIDQLQAAQQQPQQNGKKPQRPVNMAAASHDYYACFEKNHSTDEKLSKLWNEVTEIPSWVDWDQIARGQDVFYRYGLAAVTGLTYQSLLGGTGSGGDVAETLSRTGGFSLKVARKRLLETTQFILQVTESLDSIKPGGAGFETALRVRFLHAAVRRRILKLASVRPEYYSTEKFGVPINDADCISTISIFSSAVIWQSLPRQGIYPREQEVVDYIALWRLVALYMGTPTDPFSSTEQAKATLETMLLYEHQPTPTSMVLARNIIRALENSPPMYASRALLESNTRWLNGDELSDAIGVGKPPSYYWLLTAGQCLLFASLSYISRSIPILDRQQIKSFRHLLWTAVIDDPQAGLGKLSVFDFKYLPGYGISTQDEEVAEKRTHVFWTADNKALIMLIVPVLLLVASVSTLIYLVSSVNTVVGHIVM